MTTDRDDAYERGVCRGYEDGRAGLPKGVFDEPDEFMDGYLGDFHEAICANPHDASLWLIASDFLEERGEKVACWRCGGKGFESIFPAGDIRGAGCRPCSDTGQLDAARIARLTALLLPWRPGNERWHGEALANCQEVGYCLTPQDCSAARIAGCAWYSMASGCKAYIPTFALLFDQEVLPCNCGADRSGPSAEAHADTCPRKVSYTDYGNKQVIPGHLAQLAAGLRALGCEERAGEVEGLRVAEHRHRRSHNEEDEWWFVSNGRIDGASGHPTYPDACREVTRRVFDITTEPCCESGCDRCFGLRWRPRL